MVTNEPALLRFEVLLEERKAARYELLSTYIMLPAALAFSFIHSRMAGSDRTTMYLVSVGVIAVLLGVILFAKCKAEGCRVRAYQKRVLAELADESATIKFQEDDFRIVSRLVETLDYRQ